MADLPLTLDTLKSSSNESSLSLQSPLMSPQYLKADSFSSSNDMETTPERPSNLTLEATHQQQHQQPHSNVTPSSSTTILHGNISPALSSAGSLSPSFLPEMPQWKRDLIQRRKQNVQRTISASSPTSSSSILSSSPTTSLTVGGLKTSISSSSVRSLVGSNTNIDQLASDGFQQVCSTKDYTKTSLLPFASKVNKQYITTTSTNTIKPATNIKSSTTISSPLKEKAEKLFGGGQYTGTISSSTKEEITTTHQQQQHEVLTNKECKEKIPQENKKMMEENEEHFEMYRKTKEVLNDETQTTTAIITSKQQMATRLTGSAYNNIATNTSSSSSSSSILTRAETEREKLINTTQQHHNITGANVNLVNQSLNKCESERFVCSASDTNASNTGNPNSFNTNNSVTIGGISVSGNISNNQNNCSSVTSVVKISQKLQDNQFIKNEQHLNTKKIIKFKQNTSGGNNISLDLKSPTKISNVLTSSNSTSCLTSSSSTNCGIKKKMVAVQEMKKSTQGSATHLHPISSTCHATNRVNNRGGGGVGAGEDTDLDNSEDLSYGPGIVSKLRCRYLSLALRESMEQQRLNKDQLRRSTSLNNLLDNTEDEENCDDDEEADEMCDEDVENQVFDYKAIRKDQQNVVGSINTGNKKAGILKTSVNNGQEKRFSHNSQGSNGVGVTFTETSYNKRSRHLKRGNDSLKRARSVEALLSEKSPWYTRTNSSAPTCVTIEDKIYNARERLQQGTDHMPPKRLTSIIDDTERPPPDLVKQTLKMFEATANRRPRSANRSNSKGDVASKVETFKNIIKEQKPVVTFPKPLSPTKRLNTQILQKTLKTSTPHANDLLQSPLGRKTMAVATSVNNTNDCLTPLKTNNTPLSDRTPDIIPRQKLNFERDLKQNKEMFSFKEKFQTNESDIDSPLSNIKREYSKEKFEVDSPLTVLSKEFSKLKFNDTPTRKNDNFGVCNSSDNQEPVNNVGSVGGVGGGDNNGGDACQRHKYPYNNDFVNEETTQKELNISSLKYENDKISNKIKPNSNNEATGSSPFSTTIETKNEATVDNYDSSAKASSPPPSSSDLSDVGENYDDDEYGGLKTTKRITRTALDNIAKAGYTQQFKFNTANNTNTTNSSSTSTSASSSTASPLNTGKQIGVIRPLLNTQQQQQQTQQKSTDNNMSTLKHSSTTSLTSQEIEKNRINDLKKSSTTSPTNAAATSSPSSASLDHQVIKPSHTSSPATTSLASASNLAAGFSDVDSVISATNSPLWAMRKRRQTPPAAPAENTSMVFNFSNRKEVPDYIENDGVIFRRKRELPKPNESGFVLLGDLSVETSTDMDYDDFSMCPPSPCDVEFVNANIVIDGKSSIRQKSKDTTFHVQFNDTLTSTFEYPSEASLIVDESFSAYNESYAQPLDSSSLPDDFTHAFQNLNLENASHLHVADEIIQLPTLNSSSPAATNTNSPTKNILGTLPLDYPDLQKGIQLTTTTTSQTPNVTPEYSELQQQVAATDKKKSRKDLKLPLGVQQSLHKPPLPVKRFQVMSHPTAAGVSSKLLNAKSLPRNLIKFEETKQQNKEPAISQGVQQQQQQPPYKKHVEDGNTDTKAELPLQRKTPRVLNNPQYACFLKETTSSHITKPIQRSRSNEFQTTFTTLSVSATFSRSNSLRNLESVPANLARSQFTQSSAIVASSLCFSPEVISTDKLINQSKNEMAIELNAFKTPPATSQTVSNALESPSKLKNTLEPNTFLEIAGGRLNEEPNERTQSLNNLVVNSQNFVNFKENFSRSVDNLNSKQTLNELTNLKNINALAEHCINSLDNLQEKQAPFFVAGSGLDVSKTNENIYKATKSTLIANSTENSPSTATPEKLKRLASFDFELNDVKSNLAVLAKDATNSNQNNIQDSGALSKMYQQKLDLNIAQSLNSSMEGTKNLSQFSYTTSNSSLNDMDKLKNSATKSVGIISLTVNSKYVMDYRSKITENLPPREINSTENLTSQNPTSLLEPHKFEKITDSLLNQKQKSLNIVDKMINQSKSNDNLAESAFELPLRRFSISSDTFSNTMEYSLYRNITNLTSVSTKPKTIVDFSNLQDNLITTQNFENISKSADDIVMVDSIKDLTETRSKSVENMQVSKGCTNEFSKSVNDALNSVDSNELTVVDDSENLIEPKANNLENLKSSELKTESHFEPNSDDFKDTFRKTALNASNDSEDDSITNSNKSLQMSRDSLDNFEDAEEIINEAKLPTDLEASEILEDIAVGFDTSVFDFNNLLNLKKSKTAYCLQSLEKYSSLESENNDDSLHSDDSNFLSACNTLESKCSLKPRDIPIAKSESSEAKPTEEPPKKPKTLRVKTTEKILNLTNMASQNVSTYATFRKSKNFCKNASKSFKNSLRFYETFSEKTSQTIISQSPIKRSISLTENPVTKAELNRKKYSKSSKIMMKVRNIEEWDSPTENSYSFEYFDAEDDGLNGKFVDIGDRDSSNNLTIKPQNSIANWEMKQNENNLPSLQEPKEALADDNLAINFNLNDDILLSEKSINLKPISSDFYFNNSPRPFKHIYEATTLVDIEQPLDKAIETEVTGENLPEKVANNSDTPQYFSNPSAAQTANSNTFCKDLTLVENKFNYSVDFKLEPLTSFMNSSMAVYSTTISTLSTPNVFNYSPTKRANSFSTFNNKSESNNYFKKSSSFNAYEYCKNVPGKVENSSKYIKPDDNQMNNRNTTKFTNTFSSIPNNSTKFPNYSRVFENLQYFDNIPFQSSEVSKFTKNSPKAEDSSPKVHTFMRNVDSTEFSFNLTKFSANSPKFTDNFPDAESLNNEFVNFSPTMETSNENSFSIPTDSSAYTSNLFVNSPIIEKCSNSIENTAPLVKNCRIKRSPCINFSSNSLKLTKIDKHHNNFNVTPTTTSTPTATLTVKDFNKTTTKFSTTTTTIPTTTTTITTTNFPTRVVAIKNAKPSNISYINSSFSSRTTKKSYTTAKYHQNKKATTTATTTATPTFNPAPPLKNIIATINPPKVLPRRLFVNAPKTATTTSTMTAIKTTTTCNTASSTISSTCFKASSITTTTCTSANNNVPPLRRRIPGNTLYYV